MWGCFSVVLVFKICEVFDMIKLYYIVVVIDCEVFVFWGECQGCGVVVVLFVLMLFGRIFNYCFVCIVFELFRVVVIQVFFDMFVLYLGVWGNFWVVFGLSLDDLQGIMG